MGKKEFLDILRQSLEGEVDNNILEQSIRFYNEYISSQSGKSEAEVLDELGDPRLIAKTIIETENASNHKETAGWNTYGNYSNRSHNDDYTDNKDYRSSSSSNKVYHLKWYHMVAIVFILLFLFAFVIRIGWILIRLFFVFFVPIILIVLLLAMFRRR